MTTKTIAAEEYLCQLQLEILRLREVVSGLYRAGEDRQNDVFYRYREPAQPQVRGIPGACGGFGAGGKSVNQHLRIFPHISLVIRRCFVYNGAKNREPRETGLFP